MLLKLEHAERTTFSQHALRTAMIFKRDDHYRNKYRGGLRKSWFGHQLKTQRGQEASESTMDLHKD
jgi:hypothetical protein